jgi:hypothetical protein
MYVTLSASVVFATIALMLADPVVGYFRSEY